MLTVFNFDLANPVHASVFAQVCALTTQANVPMQVGVGASTPATPVSSVNVASAPVETPKTYAPAEDVACKWVQDKSRVTYTLADGKYVGQTGVRKTLNKRLKDGGATWDGEKKAWTFKSSKAAEAFVSKDHYAHVPGDTPEAKAQWLAENSIEGYYTVVTAAEIEAVRAKAEARAQKKAQKSA